jgi:hypothetical protein
MTDTPVETGGETPAPDAPAAPTPLEPQENPLAAVALGGSGNPDYADPDV